MCREILEQSGSLGSRAFRRPDGANHSRHQSAVAVSRAWAQTWCDRDGLCRSIGKWASPALPAARAQHHYARCAALNIEPARRQLDGPAIAFSASAGGVLTGTTKIVPGRLALTAVTAFFGHIPIHRVSMMRTSRRWPASFRAIRRADRSVASFSGPYPPSSLRAHLPHRRMMDCHGVGRVRISRFLFTVFHTQYVQAAARISPCICDRRFKRAR